MQMKLRVNPFSPRRHESKLSDALKFRRELGHYSQAEAAGLLGVTTRTYWSWESGKCKPRPIHRRRIDRWISEIEANAY